MTAECGAQIADQGGWIGGAEHLGNDDHARGAGGEHGGERGALDPADAEPRQCGASCGDKTDEIQAHGFVVGLGRRGEDGADGEVVERAGE